MSLSNVISYNYVFDEPRPNPASLLKELPSKFVIGFLAMVNDTLTIRGENPQTQEFLLKALCKNQPIKKKKYIYSRILPLIESGDYDFFSIAYTVEFINREIINFRNIGDFTDTSPIHEYNLLKAYLAVVDDMVEKDYQHLKRATERASEGKMLELVWPHLIKQLEFTNRPDGVFEYYLGSALVSFLEKNDRTKDIALNYFKYMGYESGEEYLTKIASFIIPHLQRKESDNPADSFFKIVLQEPEPALDVLVINPEEIQKDEKKQKDYRGLKEKPIFSWAENEYILPHRDFLINSFTNGFIFSFYNKSGINKHFRRFDDFKSFIGREFSDSILFRETMRKCFSRSSDTLRFFNDDELFNPDCYYRNGNHIFLFEFKDYMLGTEVIQSNSYDQIKSTLDEKFVGEYVDGKFTGKGLGQLSRNLQYLLNKPELFWTIDDIAKQANLKLNEMIVHPIIVHNNIYFDLPGINEYLEQRMDEFRPYINNGFKAIAPFTMIYFKYFFERLLLFTDSQIELKDELEYYHWKMNMQKLKTFYTESVNDYFLSIYPFYFIPSPKVIEMFDYKKESLTASIKNCWRIN